MKLPASIRRAARKVRARLTAAPARSAPAPVRAVRRLEPAPELQPFPDALYLYAVNAIPRNYAGRSASIVAKARIFAEQAGAESTLVTFRHSSELADIEHEMREKGTIGAKFRFVCLHDYYPDDTVYDGPEVDHPLDEPGFVWVKDPDYRIYRFFDAEGVYRFYKRYDYAGRLIVRDFFNPNRARTLREEFRTNGTLRRRIYLDLHFNLPRQEIHYRADQTPAFTVWWLIDPETRLRSVERVTVFGPDGQITEVLDSLDPINYLCLDRLIGDRRAFIMVEDRMLDRTLMNYPNPKAQSVHVLHNAHLKEPYDDVRAVRPSFRPLFEARERVPAIVFLTATQRAEAEQKYGSTPCFRVIPHAVRPPVPASGVERDPKLVIMMARLERQKQVDHAIKAFAVAAKRVPGARLEIYGRGPELAMMRDLISDLGLTSRVKLMGFTKQPELAYQRASLCLLTSRFEGLGMVVQEAMSYGCPVVSYDLRYGPADMITDGVDGFLVPYGDRTAMGERVASVLTDPALLERASRAAQQRAADFSEAVFAARWSALFNELAAG
ncbi:MAG: glycosyltransferase [Propionicimonas sp.]